MNGIPRADGANARRHPGVLHALVVIVPLACAYWFVAVSMAGQWLDDPNYAHGLFVVPMAAVLAWRRRDRLRRTPSQPSRTGVGVVAAAAIVYLVGILAAELFTMRVSLVLAAIGAVLATQGRERTRVLAFPLLFLFLMVPLPYVLYYKFTFPLQLWSSKLTAHALTALGMPVVRQGNVIDLEGYSLEVVTACSGLRSMMSLGTLALFMMDFFRLGGGGKAVLVALSIPVAVVANTFRLGSTAVIAAISGPESADSFLHELSGVAVFVSGLVLLAVAGGILEWVARRRSR